MPGASMQRKPTLSVVHVMPTHAPHECSSWRSLVDSFSVRFRLD